MTQQFHNFVDLCCQAFNFLRASGNLLLTLFSLMTSSGIPGVNKGAVEYVQHRLLLDLSNAEAAARFSQLIHESMDGKLFTQFNFFVHNLAQLRGRGGDSASSEEPGSLSFIPRKYSQEGEGRMVAVQVHGIQKRYDQEKYYLFILRVERAGQTDPTYIFRTYKWVPHLVLDYHPSGSSTSSTPSCACSTR
jgi:phosphatidylinositol-4-phosphate 3-kinase